MTTLRISALQLVATDPQALAAFYESAFACRRIPATSDGLVVLHLGAERLEIVATAHKGGPPAVSNSTMFQHFAIVVPDMAKARVALDRINGWTPISREGPEALPAASGGATAFKFRDPEGHPLELLQFAAGRVPAHWSRSEGCVFLGIDHTAITVSDTARSVAFYAGLGFAETSRQINRGIEQSRMDAVDGAIVEVTGLAATATPPHLELLCYEVPRTEHHIAAVDDPRATAIVLEGQDREADVDGGGWGPNELRGATRLRRDPDDHVIIAR